MFFPLAEGYRLISVPSMSNTGSEQLEMGLGGGWRRLEKKENDFFFLIKADTLLPLTQLHFIASSSSRNDNN